MITPILEPAYFTAIGKKKIHYKHRTYKTRLKLLEKYLKIRYAYDGNTLKSYVIP